MLPVMGTSLLPSAGRKSCLGFLSQLGDYQQAFKKKKRENKTKQERHPCMSYSQTAGCSLVNRPIIGVLEQLWAANLLQCWALPSTALGSSAPPSSTHCPGRSCQGSRGVHHIRKLGRDACSEVLPCELTGNIGLLLKLEPPAHPSLTR